MVWDPHNQRIGIDTGKKRRKTRAATMTWAPGQEPTGQYGYVIEEILILPFKWNPKKKRFEKQELAWF
ncbi:MAG: hypothetical protein IIA73_11985, partial [Proteobacteria bacterium]|nr:hypothetical protein [Pseudomonadota bacterium]